MMTNFSRLALSEKPPAGWTISRLKNTVLTCQNGIWGDEATGDQSDILCLRVADFDRNRDRVRSDACTIRSVSQEHRASRLVRAMDLLLEKSGGGDSQPVGKVVLYDGKRPAVCSNFIAVMRVHPDFEPRFLCYVHRALYEARVNVRSIKQNTGIQNLDSSSYLNEYVAFPSHAQQISVADFLDWEITKIDTLIAKKTEFIQKTKARQEALLSSLHEDSRLAPKVRLRFVADILPGNAFPSESFEVSQEGTRLLRGINVSPGEVNWDAGTVYLSQTDTLNFKRFNLLPEDVVVGMDRPWISTGLRVARLSMEDIPSLLVQRVARLRCKSEIDPGYMEFCLRTTQFMAHVLPDMTGVSVPHISDRQIGDFRVPLPTIDEQRRLASEIRHQMAFGSDLISKIKNMITIARERRSALIIAAVTGQIDVPQSMLTEAAA